MPYNPAGLFSLVASYFASPGTTIRTEQHNPVFEDVASALSNVLLRDGRAPMTGPLNMNGQPINNVVAGNSASSVATLAQGVPIGAIVEFAGSTAPAGWAMCFGQSMSRTINAALFAAIGTTYGAPDANTFNLPDCRGRVTAGRDNGTANRLTTAGSGVDGQTAGATGGVQIVALTAAQMPAHDHTGVTGDDFPDHVHGYVRTDTVGGIYPGGGFSGIGQSTQATAGASVRHKHAIPIAGGSEAHSNVQPTIVMSKIIRVSYDV